MEKSKGKIRYSNTNLQTLKENIICACAEWRTHQTKIASHTRTTESMFLNVHWLESRGELIAIVIFICCSGKNTAFGSNSWLFAHAKTSIPINLGFHIPLATNSICSIIHWHSAIRQFWKRLNGMLPNCYLKQNSASNEDPWILSSFPWELCNCTAPQPLLQTHVKRMSTVSISIARTLELLVISLASQ